MTLRAVVFDVDGTLAETEETHRQAFNQAFKEHGLGWVWDRALYRALLNVTGGRERIAAFAHSQGVEVDTATLHAHKNVIYDNKIRSGSVELRAGVADLIRHCREEGLVVAIGTTTSRANVYALLEATLGQEAGSLFASIRAGEDVKRKKPDPEVYELVLSDLKLDGPSCLCVEDSCNGLIAARAVGMRTVITPSLYTSGDDFAGADLILRNLGQPWSSPEFNPYTSLINQPLDVSRLLMHAARSGG